MSELSASAIRPDQPIKESTRWLQLLVGVICMVATANIQYAWTLFVPE
ncbi:MAG: oxalate/formate MFS antiporter, partial [Oxalicibacterium faecigallinarum]|nr:oxalate/formate MFS antiporter [Oxalicibacterium faecigallinarum]